MSTLLVFAVVLAVAVLLSELASRSVLSTSVLFLAAGVASGPAGFGWIDIAPTDDILALLAELALFSILFTDGMLVGVRDLAGAWRLPGRALLLGMPLAFAGTAALAHYLVGLAWVEALLLGAVLAPTDPVFAAAIVGREDVPLRLRRLLNVESGLNDGLALPLVLVLLALAGRGEARLGVLLGDVASGVGIGVAVPWVVLWLERQRGVSAHAVYESILAFAIALLVYALTRATHANQFLGSFAAGVTVASMQTEARDDLRHFAEVVAELLKLAALLVFGALIGPTAFSDFSAGAWLFVPLVIVLVRPVSVWVALLRSALTWQEKLAAAWFGPKGFASVVYALLIVRSNLPAGDMLLHVVAAVIALSIVVHSSTDVLVARSLERSDSEVRLD